jgi:aspartyl-tRNA(Asn)/glutamyl-tRNA(Gln) amidotransferase subunit A
MLKDFTAPFDATSVKKLRQAGAIITGQTNMDEFGMGSFGLNGFNRKPTRNPIDSDYCAGGSSSGSAAATGSFQALGALGTDTGGSVNYPAHCCGLVSLKPSFGRVSRFGQILYSSSNETTGPMAHTVADVHSLFSKQTPTYPCRLD